LVTVMVTVTSSPAIVLVGTIFLSSEIGVGFGLGSESGKNSSVAIGMTKMVSQRVRKTRLKNMNPYAMPR
jgi:shikimate kinase